MTSFAQFASARVPTLTPAQAAVASLFDRVAINHQGMLGGDWFLPQDAPAWRTVQCTAGRRSGKSLLAALHALWSCERAPLEILARGESARYTIVSPTKRQSRQILDLACGMGAERITKDTARHNGVLIETVACTRGGAGRSFSTVGATLDEAAFHVDASGLLNLGDTYRAIMHSLMPFATVFEISSPWGQSGFYFEQHEANFGHPRHAIACRAPTALMREGDANIEELIALAYSQDARAAEVEYGASFDSSDEHSWFEGETIEDALDFEHSLPITGTVCGADLAQQNDASALVMLGTGPQGVSVVSAIQRFPQKGKPLDLVNGVIPEFSRAAADAGVYEIWADSWSVQRAHGVQTHGVEWRSVPNGQDAKVMMYSKTRDFLRAERLAIHPSMTDLVAQMRACTSALLPGGGTQIRSPRVQGSHGDALSALCCAAWAAAEHGSASDAAARHVAFAELLLGHMNELGAALNPTFEGRRGPPLLNGRLFAR